MPEPPSPGAPADHREDDAAPASPNHARHYGPEYKIDMAEPGRTYLQVPKGRKMETQKNVLFPAGYYFPRSYELWKCPVHGCDLVTRARPGLGTHWRGRHEHTAFRDNGDGSISAIGTCEISMVVEQVRPVLATSVAGRSRPLRRRSVFSNKKARLNNPRPRPEQERNEQNDNDNGNGNNDEGELEEHDEPDQQQQQQREQNGTTGAKGDADGAAGPGSDNFRTSSLHKRRALLAQEDKTVSLTADSVDAYVNLLQKRHGTEGSVYVFPATFWKSRSDRPPTALPTTLPLLTKDYDSLVLPVYQQEGTGKGWYGVFVGRRSNQRLVFAVIDPVSPVDDLHMSEAAAIFSFLQKQGCMGRSPNVSFTEPDPGLPLEPEGGADADSGVFFLRALACFLANPKTFFHNAVQKLPLRWAYANSSVSAAARITRRTILYELKEELRSCFVDWVIQGSVELCDEYASGDQIEKGHLLRLYSAKAERITSEVVEAGQDRQGEAGTTPATEREPCSDRPAVAAVAAPAPRVDGHATVPATRPQSNRTLASSFSNHLRRSVSRTVTPQPAAPFMRAATAQMEVDEEEELEVEILSERPSTVGNGVADHNGTGSHTTDIFVARG